MSSSRDPSHANGNPPLRPRIDQDHRPRPQSAAGGEDPIDVSRYIESLRRSKWLMGSIVAFVTLATLIISLALAKNYEATANIVINSTSGIGAGASGEAAQRELATIATVATTTPVLSEAVKKLPGQTVEGLESNVSSSVDQNANIIHISADAGSGAVAAATANAVARAFLHERATAERDAASSALATLDGEIESLRASATTSPTVAAQLSALQTRAGELESARASATSELQLEQPAPVPSSATSPRPARNAIIALFASFFLAVLIALAREQLTPRVGSQRELGQLLDLPVLTGIPYSGRRVDSRFARAEHETYQTLAAAIQLALPPTAKPRVIVVTSAGPGEGKTTVAARLGRMLAQAGQRTLVVSGDLRAPRLDEVFEVTRNRGLRELFAEATGEAIDPEALEGLIVSINGSSDEDAADATLQVLPSGSFEADASSLLRPNTLRSMIRALSEGPYAYVIVDSPPLLGIADTQMLARFCDEMLVVGRLDRLSMAKVIDLRETLFRINAGPVGLVVIGTRPSESPYYAETPYALAPS